MVSKAIASRIGKLAEIAQELREGERFELTRLTRIKFLCQDPQLTAEFATYMAKLTWDNMNNAECPRNLEPEEWTEHKELVSEALSRMESYMESPDSDKRSALWYILPKLQQIQGQRDGPYGALLIIVHNRYAFLVESALRCLLYPEMSSRLGYELARNYAERYNSSYGTGLIPESAPLVEDITNFWCQYHLGQTLEQWKKQGFKTERDKETKSKAKAAKTQKNPIVIKRIVGSSFDKGYPSITRWVRDYGW